VLGITGNATEILAVLVLDELAALSFLALEVFQQEIVEYI